MKTAQLTNRDLGELWTNEPPLRNECLAATLKRLWADGRKPKQAAILAGISREYVRKFYKCFARALKFPNASPIEVGEGRKRPKSGVKIGKQPKRGEGVKTRKALTVNFKTSVGERHTFKGVTFNRGRGWQAQKRAGNRVKYIGIFKTPQEAAEAVKSFEQ